MDLETGHIKVLGTQSTWPLRAYLQLGEPVPLPSQRNFFLVAMVNGLFLFLETRLDS